MDENTMGLIMGCVLFSIPIIAILVKSQVGKAFANYLESKAKSSDSSVERLVQSEQMFLSINNRLDTIDNELRNIRESNDSLRKILVERDYPKQLP